MSFGELSLIGLGLSVDAFAAALSKGFDMKDFDCTYGIIIALFFGLFQGIMPVLGWSVGRQFSESIANADHWIAFAILVFIGIKTLAGQTNKGVLPAGKKKSSFIDVRELVGLSVATSIDALAIGVSFSFLSVHIAFCAVIISVITFAVCFFGVFIGNKFSIGMGRKAEIAGGIILVLAGIKILFEHLWI